MKMFKDGAWKETGWELKRRDSANGSTRWANMLEANGIEPYADKTLGSYSRLCDEHLISVHRVQDREPHGARFFLTVSSDGGNLLECLVWDGVSLMSLLSEWAPVAQTTTLDHLADLFTPVGGEGPNAYGTFEKIAERVWWVIAGGGDGVMQQHRVDTERRRLAARNGEPSRG